jgi:hypothetical protein
MRYPVRLRSLALLLPLIACAPLLVACEDDGFLTDAVILPDTARISLPGGSTGSAIDIVRPNSASQLVRFPERVVDAEQWDVALRRTDAGGLELRPYQPLGGGSSGAGIAVGSGSFETIEKAPRGTAAYQRDPLPIAVNGVYFIRSRQFSGGGIACVRYAKLRVLELDAAAGTARIALVINVGCDDERLTDD